MTVPGRGDTAFAHRDAQFIVGFDAQLDSPTPEDTAAAEAFIDSGVAAFGRYGTGAYVNFPGYKLDDWSSQYYGHNYPRLVAAKRRFDPDNFFRHPRSIGSDL